MEVIIKTLNFKRSVHLITFKDRLQQGTIFQIFFSQLYVHHSFN